MRIVIATLLLSSVAAPALAADRPVRATPRIADVGAALGDPMVQDVVAALVGNVADAVMATHVGPLARLTDPADDVRPEDTLADLEARRDPDYRRHLEGQVRGSVAAAGRAAHDAAAIQAEWTASAERVRAALAPAIAALHALAPAASDVR